MRLDKLLLSVILLLFVLAGSILIINDWVVEEYDVTANTTSAFPNMEKHIEKLSTNVTSLRGKLEETKSPLVPLNVFSFLLKASYNALLFTWDLLSIPGDLATDFSNLLGLPAFIPQLFVVGMYLLVIFFFVYIYFRFQPR